MSPPLEKGYAIPPSNLLTVATGLTFCSACVQSKCQFSGRTRTRSCICRTSASLYVFPQFFFFLLRITLPELQDINPILDWNQMFKPMLRPWRMCHSAGTLSSVGSVTGPNRSPRRAVCSWMSGLITEPGDCNRPVRCGCDMSTEEKGGHMSGYQTSPRQQKLWSRLARGKKLYGNNERDGVKIYHMFNHY